MGWFVNCSEVLRDFLRHGYAGLSGSQLRRRLAAGDFRGHISSMCAIDCDGLGRGCLSAAGDRCDRGQGAGRGAAPTLTVEEQKLLEGLFKQGLFDPTGAERVRVKTSVRTPLANFRDVVREAWFRKGTAGATGKVIFLDGEERSVPDPSRLRPIDFIGGCRSRFARAKPVSREEVVGGVFFDRPLGKPVEEFDKSPLATAAWLHRLRHDDLAVRSAVRGKSHRRPRRKASQR